ncbi:SWR1-complex subunit 2 [Tanacetum coccineum]
MESEKEEDVVFLDRASRATRGKRMTKLVDDEAEEDDEFWNQDALKEEPEPEEEADNEPDERRTRKKLVFPGKPKPSFQAKPKPGFPGKPRLGFPGKEIPKKKQKKVVSETDTSNGEDTNPEQSKSTPQDDHDEPDDNEVEKTTRKSTRTAVVVRQAERAERDATRAALQATTKPIKRKKEGEEKKITQEEMLLEAAQTEIMNLRNLERVLAREEEVKKRAIVHKAVYTGPQIRYLSKDGNSYLEFTNGVSFKSHIPTRYRDPKTGLPYATKEAFKIIRERHSSNNSGIKEKNSMGVLYDLTSQEGFTKKKRRSINTNARENSYLRSSSRFRQIPAFEDLDLRDGAESLFIKTVEDDVLVQSTLFELPELNFTSPDLLADLS